MEVAEIFTLIKKNITADKFLDDKAKQLVYHSLKKSFREVVDNDKKLDDVPEYTGEIPDILKDIFKF